MVSIFPKSFANVSVAIYLAALVVSTIVFSKWALDIKFVFLGGLGVFLFFYGSSYFTRRWAKTSDAVIEKKLFADSFFIRLVWVFFSYCFFISQTGSSFEFGAADSVGYHYEAEWLSGLEWDSIVRYLFFSQKDFSDSGYALYLTLFYRLFGVNIFFVRIIKCLLSSYSCILMYRLATRHFGLETGRMTGIFCMLMPNIIWYCGLHLKETEMVFLTVLSIERIDYALQRIGRHRAGALITGGISALLIFSFRASLGAVIILAIGCALLLSSTNVLANWKKWVYGVVLLMGMILTLGYQTGSELADSWTKRDYNQQKSMAWRAERENGNTFARYAGKAVFAPLIFTLPFPTMVEIEEQECQQMLNGGNFVKNITSFFTVFALIALLLSGDWRRHIFLIAVFLGYLLALSLSEFAQSERFHMPALPFSLMFAAYGVTHINKVGLKLFKYWPYVIFVAVIGWGWFKLAGRGLI